MVERDDRWLLPPPAKSHDHSLFTLSYCLPTDPAVPIYWSSVLQGARRQVGAVTLRPFWAHRLRSAFANVSRCSASFLSSSLAFLAPIRATSVPESHGYTPNAHPRNHGQIPETTKLNGDSDVLSGVSGHRAAVARVGRKHSRLRGIKPNWEQYQARPWCRGPLTSVSFFLAT
eukprot:2579351-Rhodomonas_salina.2